MTKLDELLEIEFHRGLLALDDNQAISQEEQDKRQFLKTELDKSELIIQRLNDRINLLDPLTWLVKYPNTELSTKNQKLLRLVRNELESILGEKHKIQMVNKV